MESNLSDLSSVEDADVYVQPHYTESYRLAIYALLCGGREAYKEYIRAEQISSFLSEEEILFILENAEKPVVGDDSDDMKATDMVSPSTYFPEKSDDDIPDLELGWPEVNLQSTETAISLLFNPPRRDTPTIKEVVRKQIQVARQVVAIAMDVFTDVDIFKELISAALRGVKIYILLDDSQAISFFNMSHKLGINIQTIKNICVRTVEGQQYQCQSGAKFHGGLDQRFILLDSQTVLHGTYSYTWSFEKINRSMVLVITGQLVSSYDEEFRRLYALSTVPALLSSGRLHSSKDSPALNVRHCSLNHLHMKSRAMHDMRGTKNDIKDAALLSRGLSVQERLHQSHLLRGHSFGEDLQKLNFKTQLKMGARDLGLSVTPERTGSKPRGSRDPSHQYLRHQARNGANQNLIPFSSETALHRWKIDTYLKEKDVPLDMSGEPASPVTSPYGSHTDVKEYQPELMEIRMRAIKSRLEETRQKRLSLQELNNLRQSQESLRTVFSNTERTKFMSSMRGPDARHKAMELDTKAQNSFSQEDHEAIKAGEKTAGKRSLSQHNVKTAADQKAMQTPDRLEQPLLRTRSDAELEMKVTDSTLSFSHLHSSGLGIQHSRMMESLTEIPEEKELSNTPVNSFQSVLREKNGEVSKDRDDPPRRNFESSGCPSGPQHQDPSRTFYGSKHNGVDLPPLREAQKSMYSRAKTAPEDFSTGSYPSPDAPSHHTEKGSTQQEGPELQRNKKLKMHSGLMADKNKVSKKEKSVQRRISLRSESSTKPTQILRTDLSQGSGAKQATKKSHLPGMSKSQDSLTGPLETDKHKSPFSKVPAQSSSKRKTAEQDQGSRSTLDSEGATVSHTNREKAYSRYEYSFSNENLHMEKSQRVPGTFDKLKTSSLNRRDDSYRLYQTQSGTDNKFGRFIQRMGNLINKNK